MLKNYLKIAVRNILKYKSYSFINIAGLSLGIASCILILSYVNFQFSFDKFHSKGERIFRFAAEGTQANHPYSTASVPAFVSDYLDNSIPEVESTVRFARPSFDSFTYMDKSYHETDFLYADRGIFEMFDFELIKGDRGSALKVPYSIVITEETAYRYFGSEDPTGKIINAGDDIALTVTGIVKKPLVNSHLQFDALISMETIKKVFMHAYEHRAHFDFFTYLLLKPGTDTQALTLKFDGFFKENAGDILASSSTQLDVLLQPLSDIHLRSNLLYDNPGNSDITYIYGLIASAVFILLIACINFVNLSTARISNRYKEIGIRKVLGAVKEQLVIQFFGESVFSALFAFSLGILLTILAFPYLQYLTGYKLSIMFLMSPLLIFQSMCILFFIGFVSSGYPVFLFSGLKPAGMLRGLIFSSRRTSIFRHGLVIFQFLISITLIIITIGVFSQLNFLRNQSLGFESGNLIFAPVYTDDMGLGSEEADYFVEAFSREIKALNGVENISFTDNLPSLYYRPLRFVLTGEANNQPVSMIHYIVEENFINTLGIEIASGRGFSEDFRSDRNNSIVINEAAAELFDSVNPIGQTIKRENRDIEYTVVGVMKDIHSRSLHHELDPMFFSITTHYHYTVIKLKPNNIENTLSEIKSVWKRFEEVHPFEYRFIDEMVNDLYTNEQQLERIVQIFTLLAISISCLGVLGFVSYMIQQRVKEIGIRKTLGASVYDIVGIFVKNLAVWIVISSILAVPLGYYCMNIWLDSFSYKILLDWKLFFVSGFTAFIIALMTVTVQTIRAALLNPVNCLRDE